MRIAATRFLVAAALFAAATGGAQAQQARRGEYLVAVIGCGDCHTPGHLLGKPDMKRKLAGSDVAFEIPGLGAFAGPNLTPDKETGLGRWSVKDIVTALRTGQTPGGRMMSPAMPYGNLSHLTEADAQAIAVYLKSLPPVHNKVPGPFGPGEKTTMLMFRILPPGQVVQGPPK